MTRPLSTYGTWGAEGLADALARAEGRPRPAPEEVEAVRAEPRMVAALYVQTGGCYYGLPGVDPWAAERDARLYAGPWPVVAHPPCSVWSFMAPINAARWGSPIDDDGGLFASALEAVRTWGGVLEHPCATRAFAAHGLPAPFPRGWQATLCGGWVCQVEQGHYGHAARKKTWLYACGVLPPDLRWGPAPAPSGWISRPQGMTVADMRKRGLRQIQGPEAAATPLPFRDLLLSIARTARAPHAEKGAT